MKKTMTQFIQHWTSASNSAGWCWWTSASPSTVACILHTGLLR